MRVLGTGGAGNYVCPSVDSSGRADPDLLQENRHANARRSRHWGPRHQGQAVMPAACQKVAIQTGSRALIPKGFAEPSGAFRNHQVLEETAVPLVPAGLRREPARAGLASAGPRRRRWKGVTAQIIVPVKGD
jgi:hypothetical protein